MTRTLIQNHQQEAEDAMESVQPILDTIDSDLEMVKLVPVLQKQMGDKLLQIKSHSKCSRTLMISSRFCTMWSCHQ